MPKLFNYTFTFQGKATYTASTYEEALEMLTDDEGDVEVVDSDCEEFEPDIDQPRHGR